MTAVSGDKCDIWLLVLSRMGDFKAYNINANGIDTTAVLSPKIVGRAEQGGSIDVSPDRKKMAVAHRDLTLCDFDLSSGTVSNALIIDTATSSFPYYGVAFSHNSTKLYGSAFSSIYQYDLDLKDTNKLKASKILIGKTTSPYAALKRSTNGKIYCAGKGTALSVINHPNLAALDCQFVVNGLPLFPGTNARYGLPNSPTMVEPKKINSSNSDTAFCSDSMLLHANYSNGSNYRWEDNSEGQNRHIYESGTYYVTYQHFSTGQCEQYTDTFHIILNKIKRNYTTTILEGMCKAEALLLKAVNLNESNYNWEDGSSATSKQINKAGTYWVSYQNDSLCEYYTDTFHVTYPKEEYEVSFITDTLICMRDTIFFKNTSDGHFNQFIWSFGDGNKSTSKNPRHNYLKSGTYRVRLIGRINDVCRDTAYTNLNVDSIIFIDFYKDKDSICVGESIIFYPQIKSNITITNIYWKFGDGLTMYSYDNIMQHAYEKIGTMAISLNAQFRACPDTSFTDTVYVFDLPEVDLGPDTSLCLNGTALMLKNRLPASGLQYFSWNTGDTTETIRVVHQGNYSLTVSEMPLGCNTTASVIIKKSCYLDIPNAFTPDGDGINDYFLPRQLLSRNITQFHMKILNRWGQIVFETSNLDGRGWDGKFNGEKQPSGVYIYLIDVEIDGRLKEQYEGNITLLR